MVYSRSRDGRVSWRGGSLEPLDLARRIVELVEDKQASDIVLLDIRPVSIVADYFVICNGSSERQIGALAREVMETLEREADVAPLHAEGDAASGWVLLDYGAVVVHIFAPAEREYYRLEELWSAGLPIVQIH